jgi:hypothetical protein
MISILSVSKEQVPLAARSVQYIFRRNQTHCGETEVILFILDFPLCCTNYRIIINYKQHNYLCCNI